MCEDKMAAYFTVVSVYSTLSRGGIGIILKTIFLATFVDASSKSNPVNFHYLPYLDTKIYSQPGDINIGDIANTAEFEANDEVCQGGLLKSSLVAETTEPTTFAVDMVNRDPDLLPNVTLGFIIRGGCQLAGIKLAMSLSFLPRTDIYCNDSKCDTNTTLDSQWLTHDVIGLIAPRDSKETIPVSILYSAAQVPVLGYESGSDELSDKELYSYFFRISAQDSYQVRAILRFIADHGWNYIQIVYRDYEYGRNMLRHFYMYAQEYGICIAYTRYVSDNMSSLINIIYNLKARIVIPILRFQFVRTLLTQVVKEKAVGHFIFICPHLMDGYYGYSYDGVLEDPAIGAFVVYPSTTHVTEYYDYIRNLDVLHTTNPWIKPVWEYFLKCSYNEGTCDTKSDILKTPGYNPFKSAMLRIDAVLAYAHAAHDLLQETCPDARGKEARACITGRLLRKYLMKVRFQGYNSFVEFDKYQNLIGNFTIRQLVYGYRNDTFGSGNRKRFVENTIGLYNSVTDKIKYTNETISWANINKLKRIAPWTNGSLPIDVPESICSRPCVPGEYKIVKIISCCWDCGRCREFERLANGNTSCVRCPLNMWPDPASDNTTCIYIPPEYQTMEDIIPMILFSASVVALIITTFIFIGYIVYRNERVIKASSKELSVIQLVAIFLGYTTVILFQMTPTDIMCGTIYLTFCMSFTMLYSPLVVKTVRIFRIFKSGIKNEKPRFISPQSQIVIALILILFQIILCGASFVLYKPGAKLTQPNWSEKMVELSCDFKFQSLISFLCYNVALVFLCAVVAFMVRGLPANFNESKFISMCVSTTLLIWLAFIPTYFSSDKEYIRGLLLCMALLLNHSIALGILFAPKLYRAKFMSQNAENFSNARS